MVPVYCAWRADRSIIMRQLIAFAQWERTDDVDVYVGETLRWWFVFRWCYFRMSCDFRSLTNRTIPHEIRRVRSEAQANESACHSFGCCAHSG